MKVTASLFLFIIICNLELCAQDRYVVFFTDKDNSPYSINSPSIFLSERSIQRRQRQGISILVNDIPVNETYIEGLKNSGISVIHKSKWMNAVLTVMESSKVSEIERLSFVSKVDYVAPNGLPISTRSTGNVSNTRPLTIVASTYQNNMLGVNVMHEEGFKGQNMLVGIFDNGFQNISQLSPLQSLFNNDRLLLQKDFVTNITEIENTESHGTRVLSLLASNEEGVFMGTAPEASYILCVTEAQGEYRVEEYNWLFAAEMADSAGVDIISTSLGYSIFDDVQMNYAYADMDGETTVITKAANMAASKGIALVSSAGNEGGRSWNFITAPADSESVLAVGAVDRGLDKASFSSFGPSSEGRIKPDVTALGQSTALINAFGDIVFQSGTSFSAPLVAGLATGLWQAFPKLTSFELLDLIKQSANQYNRPDVMLGYGIPDFIRAYDIAFIPEPIENTVLIYPNPVVDGLVNLVFADGVLNEDLELSLVNKNGQELQRFRVSPQEGDNRIRLDISNQKHGIYILRIRGERTNFNRKIIKY